MINALLGVGPILSSGSLYFVSLWGVIIPRKPTSYGQCWPWGPQMAQWTWATVLRHTLSWHLTDLRHLTSTLMDPNRLPVNPPGKWGPQRRQSMVRQSHHRCPEAWRIHCTGDGEWVLPAKWYSNQGRLHWVCKCLGISPTNVHIIRRQRKWAENHLLVLHTPWRFERKVKPNGCYKVTELW